MRQADIVAVPQIWNQEGRPLDKPFVKFLGQGSMTSNPGYWKTIHVFFDRLRCSRGTPTSELLHWVNQGLLVGVKKEMRPSVAIAQQVTYTILIEIIQDVKDDGARSEAWTTEFAPKLREYLTSTGAAVGQPGAAFGYVLTRINDAKDFQRIWGTECQYLIDLMSESPVTSLSNVQFPPVSDKWIEIVLSMLRNFRHHEANPSASIIFSRELQKVAKATLSTILGNSGHWIDGMSFLATLVENRAFTSSDFTTFCLQDLKVLMSSENVVKLLHSPSSEKFIVVLVVLLTRYGQETREIWSIVINEAIPSTGVIGVNDPNSLFSHILSILDNPKPGLGLADFVLADGININLVREIAMTPKPSDNERSEKVLRSLINLRGRPFLCVAILTVEGILVSQQTATALLILAILYSKNWSEILGAVLQKDTNLGLAESLLDMKNQELKQEDVFASWDISKFLQKIYAYCILGNATNVRTADTALREIFKRAISSSGQQVELINYCLTSVKNEIQITDLDGKTYGYGPIGSLIGRLKLLGDFSHWLIMRMDESKRKEILTSLFSVSKQLPVLSFPDSSLSLTSSLGHVFLPFIAAESRDDTRPSTSVAVSGRFSLFYLQILLTGMSFIGTRIEGDLSTVIHYLLLHSALSKDKLAHFIANDLWTINSNVNEIDFLDYQAECIQLVKKVVLVQIRYTDL